MGEAAELIAAGDVAAMATAGAEGLVSTGTAGIADASTAAENEQRAALTVQELLEQLRREPSSESECTAKFKLYEAYAQEVEDQRKTLLKLYGESRESLPASVVNDMDRMVGKIDSHEAMGIPDDAHEWFVYHMMRQAERNNFFMAKILENFEKKLAFLARNDQLECPVCLESFLHAGPRAAETLGCCHKVCHECWDHWSAITRGRPFCPLCRRDDFLERVSEAIA